MMLQEISTPRNASPEESSVSSVESSSLMSVLVSPKLGKRRKGDRGGTTRPSKVAKSGTQYTLLRDHPWLERASSCTARCKWCNATMRFDSWSIGRHQQSDVHSRYSSTVAKSESIEEKLRVSTIGATEQSWMVVLENSVAKGICPSTLNNFLSPEVLKALKNISTPLSIFLDH